MTKKITVIITMLAMILVFCVPVLAADSHIIYGEQSNTKTYNGYIEELFSDNTFGSLRAKLINFDNNNFYSIAVSRAFYSSTGKIRVDYTQYSTSNGTVTARLVNSDTGAESMPIAISGTTNQTKSTTLTWTQVPNGYWYVKLTLSPAAPSGNPWIVRGDVYDD